jgi:predicted ester cyclase
MSTEENKARMNRIPLEVFNEGKLGVIDEVMAADYVEHLPTPGFPSGIAGLKQFVTAVRVAFPDFKYTVDESIAEGDKVVQRVTARGTMKGAFAGMAATGKQATWTEIHISRLAGGKLVEHWATVDQLGMLQQLGVIPTPGQAG